MPERALLAGLALALAACAPPTAPAARAFPAFATGDECLFCHRDKIGAGWEREAHNRTVRRVLDGEADPVEYVLGEGAHARFLKGAGFGRLALLSKSDPPTWDADRFGDSCAGCHATAVDPATRRFEAVSLDCFVCHGDVPRGHTEDPGAALLTPRRTEPARVATSLCAQCHLRGGRSRSTGLPYPARFVAGDDLFRDFEVDLGDEALARASAADRHVLENVRAVLGGDERTTCLSCHSIHRASHAKHRRVPEGESCYTCHVRGAPMKERRPFTRGSPVCEY